MWTKELIELSRNEAYPGTMMKSSGGKFGMIKKRAPNGIEIVSVELKDFMPSPTSKVIATYKNIEEMLADGWVID